LQAPERLQSAEAGWGPVRWVLARALCRFKVLDLGQVPTTTRAQALALQLAQWSPYPHTAHHTVWQGGRALVWAWDHDVVLRTMAEAGVAPQRVQVWPESVLLPPMTAGLRLVHTLQGVEGQCWKGGLLLQSRWWKDAPGKHAWLDFQRDLGLPAEERLAEVPPVQTLALQATPTLRSAGPSGLPAGWRDERLAYALGALLLFAPTAWMATGLLKTQLALQALQASISDVEGTARPLMAARGQATRIAARAQALVALEPYPNPLDLMARVAGVLPKNGTYLKEWDFQEGKLKVVLVTPGTPLSSSTLVSALQLAGGFDNVQVVPANDPKVVVITMEVVPVRATSDV